MTEIITRNQAIEQGKKYYFTGVPCKNNHTDNRYTKHRACVSCLRDNNTQFRNSNPERAREHYRKSAKQQYDKNPQKNNQGTMCWRQKNRADYLASCKRVYEKQKTTPQIRMLQGAKNRAKKYGLPFDITAKDIIIPECCPVLGHLLDRKSRDSTPSLDRIVPQKGYVKGNIIVISCRANVIKNNATVDEIFAVANFFKKITNGTFND